MLVRTPLRLSAAALSVLVAGIAASPALAAATVAEGTATAVKLTVAGTPADSGTYTASNDGTKETTSGNSKPAIGVLGGQQLISEGTLAQLAKTTVSGRKVSSVACAGLAGQGATVAAVGDATCLSGGNTLALNAGNVDLTKLSLTDLTLPGVPGVPADLSVLTGPLSTALTTALNALGNPQITLDAGALQASCLAVPRSANGSSDLGNASLDVTLPAVGGQAAQKVSLVSFDANPAPNTPINQTPSVLVDALTKSLKAGLASANLPNIPGLDNSAVLTAALSTLTTQLSDAGFDQLVSGTLNKQSRSGASSIHVTALDLNVLPAASAVAGGSGLAGLQVGDVTCSAGTTTPATTTTTTVAKTPRAPAAAVPTSVDSGLAGDQPSSPVLPVVGGLMLLGAAGIGVRRLKHARG